MTKFPPRETDTLEDWPPVWLIKTPLETELDTTQLIDDLPTLTC